MALQHLRSGTADKRPTPGAMSDGQLAINTNATSTGLFFKDSAGALVKVGPVHIGTTAPNATPASGGQSGNTVGEQWLDTTGGNYVLKIWDGSAWRSEAGEFVNASGDTMTGALVMDNQQQVRFRETTANGTNFIALQAPASVASDKTITLPDVTGTVVTTGDTGTVTSTMLLDGTILNADVNASAAIAGTKIAPDFGSQTIATTGVFSHALGAAATPSVTFTGDTNTGIYSPGADQVAISTNGTGRLFVDANGNVGVGTSSPANFAGFVTLALADSSGAEVDFIKGSTVQGSVYNAGDIFYIESKSTVPTAFVTNGSERMRLDSSGRLGLGTSSPATAFEVQGNQPQITIDTTTTGYTGLIFATNGVNDGGIYYNGTDDKMEFYTADTSGNPQVVIDASGRVGVGTTTPSNTFQVGSGFGVNNGVVYWGSALTGNNRGMLSWGTNLATIESPQNIAFFTNSSERGRWDSSGRFLVGTSTAPTTTATTLTLQGNSGNSAWGANINLQRGTTNPSSGDDLGIIWFGDAASSLGAQISAHTDGTWASGDYPGRLVFSTTADGASSPTERMRITNSGFLKVSNTGTYGSATGAYHAIDTNQTNQPALNAYASSLSYAAGVFDAVCGTTASNAYSLIRGYSGNGGDMEFNLRGDGNAYADGSWNGGGADYAEYFEWSDGNPDEEDRRGISVVLDGDQIRPAEADEDPIGVISGNPSVVGDAAWNKWSGKHLRDDYGTYILEDYEVVNDEGETVVQQRRKLNPAYDPDQQYVNREQRPEWDCVGLMGKLRIRKGQPTGSRWIKMRDISDSVEEWLVR